MVIFLALLEPADKVQQSENTSLATANRLVKTIIVEAKKLHNEVQFEKAMEEVHKGGFGSESTWRHQKRQ